MKCFCIVQILHPALFHRDAEPAVRLNSRQFPAELRQWYIFSHGIPGTVRCDLFHMGDNIFHCTIEGKQFQRRLLPHTRHPRDIVRGISHKTFQVDDLQRGDPHTLDHIRCVVIFHQCFPTLCFGDPYFNLFCGKLEQIPVARHNSHFKPLFFSLARHSPQYIICFYPLFGKQADIHSM